MTNETIELRGHTTRDGMLTLNFNAGVPDSDVTVTVKVQPAGQTAMVDSNGWPIGYFDEVVGSMPDLERGPQGDFEDRLSLE